MKYPVILESNSEHDNRVVLAFNKNECQCINSWQMSNYCGFDFDTSKNWKNITSEYLQNTYGEVVSTEHAEFIIELAKNAGLNVCQYVGIEKRYTDDGSIAMERPTLLYNDFIFEDDTLFIGVGKYPDEMGNNLLLNKKQITIPLPPKADNKQSVSYTITKGIKRINGCEDFELCGTDSIGCAANVSVSFNDNDEILKVKAVNPPKADKKELSEFPQVGDEVEFKPNPSKDDWVKASIEYIGDKFTILKSDAGREFSRRNSKLALRKPKTPEEEWLYNAMERVKSMGLSAKDVEKSLLSVFNKKPQ